ncbi:MAG: UDP-glucose/GDP-mannose dehydrogenase family protein, partial [Thermodesulfovibrionales bacterium]|nr:UDP-glucose/GDP-mannose dehydrogenase family protein [Thermodesulfovibrionales bacterium]
DVYKRQLLKDNLQKRTIIFTTDIKEAIKDCEIVFIAVGTPQSEDGSADMKYVRSAAQQIGDYMENPLIIANKSTVPVGTADMVREIVQDRLERRSLCINFDVVSNPEFLKEGDAINDFLKPDRVIVGSDSEEVMAKFKELYAPFTRNHERFIGMDIRSAEMTKYAANAMLATRISFMNEMANICERVGADINKVRVGLGSDKRIGYHFIYPGCGFGGSCFPKDLRALEKTALDYGYRAKILAAVIKVNEEQKHKIYEMVKERFKDLKDLRFAIWGLSFKPETDDMREASAITIIEDLTQEGAYITAYDPKAMEMAKKYWLKDNPKVSYSDTKYETLKGADALIIVTEWKEFRSPDFIEIKSLLKQPIIFDGRNLYDYKILEKIGFEYYQIGRKRRLR